MSGRLIGLIFLISNLSSCGGVFDNYSPDQIHKTVQRHPNHEGLYLVHYRYKQMIDKFGPGWEKTLEAVRRAKSSKEVQSAWIDAQVVAVPKYMYEKDLIPRECVKGIVIISIGMDEAGGGTAAFRCEE